MKGFLEEYGLIIVVIIIAIIMIAAATPVGEAIKNGILQAIDNFSAAASVTP